MDETTAVTRLAIALAIGLIIGMERGWHERALAEGQRVAGLRTFGLIALLGGVAALLGQGLGGVSGGGATAGLVLAAALLAIVVFLAIGYWHQVNADALSATTAIAAVLAFMLGALAVAVEPAIATAAAVVTALLLQLKPVLHAWLRRTEPHELAAALQLLLISAVILPFLPDRGFGPGAALNPYRLWWMVVLICALTFAGYVAVRWLGPARGVIATALFGGLVSSTAVTLSFARRARAQPPLARPPFTRALGAGVVLACTVMFARIAVVAAAVAPGLALALAPALAAAAFAGCACGAWLLWRDGARAASPAQPSESRPAEAQPLGDPVDLRTALQFAALLAIVLALASVARERLGDAGVNALAMLAGITDVDAITLSAAELVHGGMGVGAGARAVLLAAAVNTVVKAGIAVAVAGGALARIVAAASAAMLGAGALAHVLTA
jgi:uncharacterized membrane protein (DUF4010 family)